VTTLIVRAAASFVAGRIDLEALPEGARQRHCAQRDAVPVGHTCTIACPAPRRGEVSARSVVVSAAVTAVGHGLGYGFGYGHGYGRGGGDCGAGVSPAGWSTAVQDRPARETRAPQHRTRRL